MRETEYYDLTVDGATLEASLSDYGDGALMFAVGADVVVTFAEDPPGEVADLDWTGFVSADPQGPAVLLGALSAFRALAAERFEHVREVRVRDASAFESPGTVRETDENLASVLAHGRTVYQRLLNAVPETEPARAAFKAALDRLRGPVTDDAPRALRTAGFDAARAQGVAWWRYLRDPAFVRRRRRELLAFFGLDRLTGEAWVSGLAGLPSGPCAMARVERTDRRAAMEASARCSTRAFRAFMIRCGSR